MAMDGFTKDMNIIQQLNDEPNDRDGLTAGELKAKFDEGGLALKDYLNNTVKPFVDGMEGTEAAHEADTVKHITAAERTAWNGKYDKTGGVLTGNVTVQPTGSPMLTLSAPEKSGTGRSKTVLQKNAGASADYGTQLIDYTWGDGTTANQRTILRVLSATVLADRLMLIDYAAGGDYVMYHLYGEHNKPGVAGVTGLQAALDGKVDKVTGKGLSTNDYTTAEKNKLAGIAAGAQVNSITGVKGNAESSYRTGNVNLTPANLGAATYIHTHAAGDISSGTLPVEKGGTGQNTAKAAASALIVGLDSATANVQDGTLIATSDATGETNTWYKRPASAFWNYIKGKSNALYAALSHTHPYLPLTGGTLTGSLTIDPTGNSSPMLSLVNAEKSGVGPSRVNLYKNANASVDYGTQLADYTWGDGGTATNRNARLVLRSASTSLPDMLTLNVNEGTGGSTTVYKLYGEHNKPYVTAGQKSGTTLGPKATAEGDDTTASGDSSHAEGWKTTASELASHAEGCETVASGEYSHAEGYGTKTTTPYAHAEGCSTEASGTAAHAEGYHTIANRDYQHVFGQYNASSVNSVEIVGWGTSSARKNIRTLDGSGNMTIAGTLTQASDARLKDIQGEVPDVSGIRAVRFKWNDVNGEHDENDHIGYIAQEVEQIVPFLVGDDSNGYKSLDYIALLCAKVEMLERQVRDLTEKLEGGD